MYASFITIFSLLINRITTMAITFKNINYLLQYSYLNTNIKLPDKLMFLLSAHVFKYKHASPYRDGQIQTIQKLRSSNFYSNLNNNDYFSRPLLFLVNSYTTNQITYFQFVHRLLYRRTQLQLRLSQNLRAGIG